MPKYSYTVINQEGQKLTGTIEAGSEDAARDNLGKLGFPILEITEIPQEITGSSAPQATSQKFEFQAVDQNGRKVVGTITAEDTYGAFKRLINEYHFAVEYLNLSTLSPEAKEEGKKRGAVELYTLLKNEQAKMGGNAKSEEDQANLTHEEEEQTTMKQVDFVLQKVQSLLQDFSEIVRPEDKSVIQKKSDRLARLKASKNTDYVKHLAEDLLLYIQNEEIFLTKEKSDQKVQSFRLDVKKLMNQIHHDKMDVTLRQDILNSTSNWLANHLKNNTDPAWWEKAMGSAMNFITSLLSEPPEVTNLKEKIRIMNGQIWDYYKMYIKEDTIEGRKEIKESIRTLKEQRAEVKIELAQIRNKLAEQAALPSEQSVGDKIIAELISITGWLFAVYFAIHTIYIYLAARALPFGMNSNTSISNIISILKISQTKSFAITMLTILVIHAFLRLRSMFTIKKTLGNLIIMPTLILSVMLIMYNF